MHDRQAETAAAHDLPEMRHRLLRLYLSLLQAVGKTGGGANGSEGHQMKFLAQYAWTAPVALLLALADISNAARAVVLVVILVLVALRDYMREQA
jgi:hypothetical protein